MLLLSTDTLKGYGLNRIFEFAKTAGYDGIDLQIDPKSFDTTNAAYIKAVSDSVGLPVKVVCTQVDANQKEVLEAVEIAKTVEAKIVVIQAPKILNFKYTKWLTKEIPKIREKERISIALENSPADTFLGFIPEHALSNISELKKFKHACLDTSRVAERHQDLIRTYHALQRYLVHVHLSNVSKGKRYYLLGDGILPLESFLTKLKQDDYKGYVAVKVNPKFIKAGEDEKMIKYLSDFKEYFNKYFENIAVQKDPNEEQKPDDENEGKEQELEIGSL